MPVEPRDFSGWVNPGPASFTALAGSGGSMSRGPHMATNVIRRGARLSLRTQSTNGNRAFSKCALRMAKRNIQTISQSRPASSWPETSEGTVTNGHGGIRNTDGQRSDSLWGRTSGTSCAVDCHAESERRQGPLGLLWRGLRRFELTLRS
jgi:hypothetical protein